VVPRKGNQARSQWFTPVILPAWEAEIRRIGVWVRKTPISKITRAKRTGGVAQVVEHLFCDHLLCKLKILTVNPSPTKKKKEKGKTSSKKEQEN
jgi:hypothetical protein